MFALADGYSFYVSCERVFRPSLVGRPVIVLSNNDGRAIARSNEVKALGIRIGQPWFQCRQMEQEHGLVALPANFALRYSARMGTVDPQHIQELAVLVQRMVDESGDPVGFDAHAWITRWIHRPLPALGGVCPVQYMKTPDDRDVVKGLVLSMQSGAYQ